MKNENENDYYNNHSIKSFSSGETKMDRSVSAEIQLRLQDEPLYQFYNAAVIDVSINDYYYIIFLLGLRKIVGKMTICHLDISNDRNVSVTDTYFLRPF